MSTCCASVNKFGLKCQNFRITISFNYSKNFGEISSKIFSKLTVTCDYFPDVYLKLPITHLFLKLFPKYRKNVLEISCFKNFLTFPLNFLRISESYQFFQNFGRHTNFLKIFESLFPQIVPILGKFWPYIFPKFVGSLPLKISNIYFLKLFLYASYLPRHVLQLLLPCHPACYDGNLSACQWRTLHLRRGSFRHSTHRPFPP